MDSGWESGRLAGLLFVPDVNAEGVRCSGTKGTHKGSLRIFITLVLIRIFQVDLLTNKFTLGRIRSVSGTNNLEEAENGSLVPNMITISIARSDSFNFFTATIVEITQLLPAYG